MHVWPTAHFWGDVIFSISSLLLSRPPTSRALSSLHSLSMLSISPLNTLTDCFFAAGVSATGGGGAGGPDPREPAEAFAVLNSRVDPDLSLRRRIVTQRLDHSSPDPQTCLS